MKKISLSALLLVCMSCCFGQRSLPTADTSFLGIFSKIAFQRASDNAPMLRRWSQDIKIYIEDTDPQRVRSFRNSIPIDQIQPLLNGLSISWVADKNNANYLIEFDTTQQTHYHVSWDRDGNLYKCIVNINKKNHFAYTDQAMELRHYFLTSLGHFYFAKNISYPSLNSCLYSLLNDISEFDKKVIKLEYSNELKPGMTPQEFTELLYKWKYSTSQNQKDGRQAAVYNK